MIIPSKKYSLSIIIPTFKEGIRIERCIVESMQYLRNCKLIDKFEIIFASDRSPDDTIKIIKRNLKKYSEIRLLEFKERHEKGGAIKAAVQKAKYHIVLFYDADLSTPLYEIETFLSKISSADVLIASRGMKESKVQKKIIKILLSKAFSLFKYLLLGIEFQDTQCGFKMFNKRSLKLFEFQTLKSSAFDVELLFLAKKWKLTVKEIPVTWIDSDMSNFSTFNVILKFIKDMFRIKINDLNGVYDLRKD